MVHSRSVNGLNLGEIRMCFHGSETNLSFQKTDFNSEDCREVDQAAGQSGKTEQLPNRSRFVSLSLYLSVCPPLREHFLCVGLQPTEICPLNTTALSTRACVGSTLHCGCHGNVRSSATKRCFQRGESRLAAAGGGCRFLLFLHSSFTFVHTHPCV